jgi:hypothetical protein
MFQIKIKLGETVSTGTISKGKSKGKPYSRTLGSVLKKDGSVLQGINIMAFDKERASVVKLLKPGREITVTAEWDGYKNLKILGPRRARRKPAAAAAAA